MIDRPAAPRFHHTRRAFDPWRAVRSVGWAMIGIALAFGGAGGCGLISLATLGTVATAAGPAVSAGQEIYSSGKLDTAEMQRADDVVLAARKAALEMGLGRRPNPNERGARTPFVRELEFVDRKGDVIKVTVDQRAERLVLLRIDVGLFGSQPIARLFLTRMRAHLPDPVMRRARSGG